MTLSNTQKDLYRELLEINTVHEDIHALLKQYKDDNKEIIRLSGSKSDLISNLFDAVNANIINVFEVQELIKDGEEYGDQHILLYSLVDNSRMGYYNNASRLADNLIPNNIRPHLPSLTVMPTGFTWGDFRNPNKGIQNSWFIKFYDIKERYIKEDESFNSSTDTKTVTYKRIQSRMVYSAEWNGVSELALKMNRTSFDSSKSLRNTLSEIKTVIGGGGNGIIVDHDFAPIDLRNCIKNMMVEYVNNNTVYKVLSANFEDSQGGAAEIRSHDDLGHYDLLSEAARKEAVEAYLSSDAIGTGIVLKFLSSGSNGTIRQDINVIIGREGINHMIIPAKIKPQEYSYVKRQIERFN